MRNYYKSGIIPFLLLFMFGIHFGSTAQVSNYTFSSSAGTYAPISGGTVLGTATNDDDNFNALPIGFTFYYNGTAYTQASVNNNGFLAMGGTVTSSYTSLSTGGTNNAIAGLNRDLQGAGGTSELRYETIGTAPYRTFVVQFKDYKKYGTNGTGDVYNFQIRLNETTNTIEIRYGSFTNNANTATPQVGLRGASNADFNNRTSATDWTASTAGATNGATMTVTSTVFPPSGLVYVYSPQVPTPGIISQSGGTPTCLTGTDLTAAGTPPANTTWYWQTSATGTAMAATSATPYTVYSNATYYLRAYNSVTATWSYSSTAYTVSNIPVYSTPPSAPTAAANPACVPGTTISVAAAPAGVEYYWQGTNSTGASNATPATAPYNVASTGTYYVAAYETATGCWSGTSSVSVTVSSVIPNEPVITTPDFYVCSGATTAMIEANATYNLPGSLATTQAGGNGCTNGNMFDITAGAQDVIITSFDVTPNASGAQTVAVYYKTGTYLGSETNSGAWTLLGNYPITGVVATLVNMDCADLTIPAGQLYGIYLNYNAQYTSMSGAQNYSNSALTLTTGAGLCTAFSGVNANRAFNGVVHYTVPVNATTTWYDGDLASATQIGTGSPFESIGTGIIANPAPAGTYNFYPAAFYNGCTSTHTTPVVVHVNPVNVEVTPVAVSCNGSTDGTFIVSDTICGATPFTYSVDGGAFGAIPANLTAGTHTVQVQDATSGLSGVYTIEITEPGIPQALNAFNINYFNAQLTWDAQGSETSWIVIYGPDGFDPVTDGETVNATNDTITVEGLEANTAYDFYVMANCGTFGMAGPYSFNTDPGFLAWDNTCGPGFNNIATTGTAAPSMTDDAEFGVTLPFTFIYQGTPMTTATIGNNGGLALGTLTAAVGFSNTTVAATTPENMLMPWNDDMSGSGDGVFYQTIGTAPNRQFIVQWNREHLSVGGGDQLIYQVVLDEATNEFWYLYNDVLVGNSGYDYGASATIGASGAQDVQISFNSATYLTSNSCVHFYYALCPNPTNLTTLPFEEEAQVSWSAGLYGETNWTIVYGPEGFDPETSGTTVTSTSTTITLTPLLQNTQYDVYVYAECAADDLTSENGLFGTFLTKSFCSKPTALAAATDVDSLEASWNWVVNPTYPAYAIESFSIEYGTTGFEQGEGVNITSSNGTALNDTVVDPDFIAGGVYQYYVQAVCGAGDSISAWAGPFTFTMPLTNDLVCGADIIPVDSNTYVFNNQGATVETGEGAVAPQSTGAQQTDGWINSTLNNTVWFRFTAPASGSVRVNATGISYNGQAAVYTVGDCGNFSSFEVVAANDNEIDGTSLAPNFTVCGLEAGEEYYLLFDGFNGTTGNYSLALSAINLEAGTAAPVTDVCSEENVDLFTTVNSEQTGGMWSSSVPAVNANISGADFETEGLAYNTFTLQYRVMDGCAYDSVLTTVHVFAPSSAGIDGTISACRNEPIDLLGGLGGNADLEGTWYNPSDVAITGSEISASNIQGSYSYDYVVSNGVCPSDTALVVVNVGSCDFLSLNEEVFNGVEVFPNPSEGIVFITSDLGFSYEVTDANGRVITKAENGVKAAQKTEINLNGVERGVYFIRLNNDDAQKTYRIVIR